ncbi:glycosyltransferase family 76 protein [Piedraia hortae CBS 480.64]|uniref:GPI mannosyltransferase 2 n=1 Tax=Piedraia hortae CBS 480.64 TaxID=1314780 RepID=A0A6A7BY85_9PEZI|nr:glycosyltransferase family 76 protein [Piedraia hortae CBS 480.64]
MSHRASDLIAPFVLWKLLLLAVALSCPGPGYDTSTGILHGSSEAAGLARKAAMRLTRWDALYFSTTAARGHLYEQEWAFSWLLSRFVSSLSQALPITQDLLIQNALIGSLVACVSHALAVATIYKATIALLYFLPLHHRKQLAYATAVFHIFSPAGIILMAPYGEAPFALLQFVGMYCYVRAVKARVASKADAVYWTILTGICFALSATIRSNGVLSGLIFVWDLVEALALGEVREVLATGVAGTILAIGFAFPQVIAFYEFCTDSTPRPWCSAVPPSIYTFVQREYWDVGFLRYWKLSNLPLFALALPMAWVLTTTAWPALVQPRRFARRLTNSNQSDHKAFDIILRRFAVPQLVLVLLALTSFHCQIINRISSGYPLWYFCLAISQQDRWHLRAMITYALVHAGLYAAFMPPA